MNALLVTLLIAATPITLEEVRQESRDNNNAARLSELDAQRASAQVQSARSAILPQAFLQVQTGLVSNNLSQICVQLPGGAQQCDNAPFTASTGNFRTVLGLNQLIFDGGRWWKQLEQAGATEEAAVQQLNEQRLTSEYEGMRRFYELYRAQRGLEVLDAAAKRSAEQLDRANALFEAGRMQKNEAIAAQVNLGNDQITVLRQRSRLGGSQADLAVWLARPGREELLAKDPAVMVQQPAPAPAFDAALATAKEHRPVLQALERQAHAAALATSVARGSYWPRLAAMVNYVRNSTDAARVFNNPARDFSVLAGFNLQWDFFSGFSTTADVAVARAQQSVAELNLAQAERELEADLRRSLIVLEMSISTAQVAARNREAAGKGLILAEERFKAGAGSTLEVRDAQLKLTQSELAVLESRIDVEIARANLERVMGVLGTGAST